MKEIFFEEIVKTVDDFKKNRKKGIAFVMLTDTKLCDTVDDTAENIRTADSNIYFDFIIHMGNFINGNNPRNISMTLLDNEFKKISGMISKKEFYPVQGRTDGYRDETFYGQLAMNIMTNELWDKHICFVDDYKKVSRPEKKPYYYVDYDEQKVRIIVLCAFDYQINERIGYYVRNCEIDAEQAQWLAEDALKPDDEWTVLIFSGAIPGSVFETGKYPFIYQGYSTEPILRIVQEAQENGVNVACWFSGGYGYDCIDKIAGINFVLIDSQIPQAARQGNDIIFNRYIGTKNQDCWDAVMLNTEDREIKLFRFGYGDDRVIKY